jgi:hypothetical protein
MRSFFILFLVIALAICFTTDPTPTVPDDMTDRTGDGYLYDIFLDSNNIKNEVVEHFCPRCDSHSLTFEGLNTAEGKQIQLISCRVCGFEGQETWTLPNWFWLKLSSYLPHNHWTSKMWNEK